MNKITLVTLDEEIRKLSDDWVFFEKRCGEDWIKVCSGNDVLVSISFDMIHKLSETIKRHRKQ